VPIWRHRQISTRPPFHQSTTESVLGSFVTVGGYGSSALVKSGNRILAYAGCVASFGAMPFLPLT